MPCCQYIISGNKIEVFSVERQVDNNMVCEIQNHEQNPKIHVISVEIIKPIISNNVLSPNSICEASTHETNSDRDFLEILENCENSISLNEKDIIAKANSNTISFYDSSVLINTSSSTRVDISEIVHTTDDDIKIEEYFMKGNQICNRKDFTKCIEDMLKQTSV
ncbi:hypothetical protein FF38_00353 [Lucilia cuprina]|uniref:Uncharacterized protein n=1 Tax=Lucilia cuprina TaxID=7375 RepID=A0A0L0CCS2_LUCCU|nr:hypothetical protein FF38_00353 [Lucilia cuprina]